MEFFEQKVTKNQECYNIIRMFGAFAERFPWFYSNAKIPRRFQTWVKLWRAKNNHTTKTQSESNQGRASLSYSCSNCVYGSEYCFFGSGSDGRRWLAGGVGTKVKKHARVLPRRGRAFFAKPHNRSPLPLPLTLVGGILPAPTWYGVISGLKPRTHPW